MFNYSEYMKLCQFENEQCNIFKMLQKTGFVVTKKWLRLKLVDKAAQFVVPSQFAMDRVAHLD